MELLVRRKRVKQKTGNTLFRAYSTEQFLGKEGLQSGRMFFLWDLGKSSPAWPKPRGKHSAANAAWSCDVPASSYRVSVQTIQIT